MDCSTENGGALDYGRVNCCLGKESIIDTPDCFWSDVAENQEDISYVFDEATPVKKDCPIFSTPTRKDNMNKEEDDFIVSSSQAKRRRMLNFDDLENDPCFRIEEITSSYRESHEIIAEISEEALPDPSHWASGLLEDVGLDMQSQDWVSGVLNDVNMHLNGDDFGFSPVTNAHQLDYPDSKPESEPEPIIVQEKGAAIVCPRTDFKGRKVHGKITTSIAYPFAFIKPCSIHGDVTLKDINQIIRAKPNPMHKDHYLYPTSALTGKPVVGKVKLCMDGGKGSLTIMKTRG